MNAHCGEERGSASGSKWGYLIAGAILLNGAAVVQFALGDLSERARAKLPGVLFSLHAAGGKVPLTVPIALLGAVMVVFSLIPDRRPDLPPPPVGRLSSVANRNPPRARVPAPPPVRRAAAHQPAADGDEALPIGEELPDQEQPPPAPRPAPASPTTPRPMPRFKTKSTGNVELASAKYLDKHKKPGRDSHQG